MFQTDFIVNQLNKFCFSSWDVCIKFAYKINILGKGAGLVAAIAERLARN